MGPLHVACAKGYADIAEVLVSLGGRTSENKGVSNVSLLAKVGPGGNEDRGAGAIRSNLLTWSLLQGSTPLHIAAGVPDNTAVARVLLCHGGVDVNGGREVGGWGVNANQGEEVGGGTLAIHAVHRHPLPPTAPPLQSTLHTAVGRSDAFVHRRRGRAPGHGLPAARLGGGCDVQHQPGQSWGVGWASGCIERRDQRELSGPSINLWLRCECTAPPLHLSTCGYAVSAPHPPSTPLPPPSLPPPPAGLQGPCGCTASAQLLFQPGRCRQHAEAGRLLLAVQRVRQRLQALGHV